MNKLLRDQHLEVQDPTFRWLLKWVERINTEEKDNGEFVKAMMGMTT